MVAGEVGEERACDTRHPSVLCRAFCFSICFSSFLSVQSLLVFLVDSHPVSFTRGSGKDLVSIERPAAFGRVQPYNPHGPFGGSIGH